MSSRPQTVRTALAAVRCAVAVAAGSLLLAGCGGSDQPVTPRTTTVTVTPGATPTSGPATSPTSTTSTTKPADKPPATYDEATRLFAAATVDAAAKNVFTSPTGNIFCSIAIGGSAPAGCELRDGRVPAPADMCPTGGGGAGGVGRVEWGNGEPKPVCNSDSIYQAGAVVLQYGSIATAQGSTIRCLSQTTGMTCIDTQSKQGFFIARNTLTTF